MIADGSGVWVEEEDVIDSDGELVKTAGNSLRCPRSTEEKSSFFFFFD